MRSYRDADHFAGLETQNDLLFDKKRDFSEIQFLWGRCMGPDRALIGPYRALHHGLFLGPLEPVQRRYCTRKYDPSNDPKQENRAHNRALYRAL